MGGNKEMLKRKLAVIILVATMTNIASTPLTVFAETLRADNAIQQSQMEEENEVQVRKIEVSRFEPYYSQGKVPYDELFKMDNSNIERVYANGGHLNYYSTIANMTDSNVETYWETAKQNSSSFNNEVIFTLKKSTVLNRIAYKAAFNTVGFAENFEIWTSTTDEDDFQLVGTGSATRTTDVVEFKFEPTEFKKIKFVYKSAYQNKATASEFMFYKEDKIYDVVNNMFTNGLMNELREEVNSLDKIIALENQLTEYPLKEDYKEVVNLAKEVLENPAKYQEGILTASQRGDANKEAREHQIARATYNLDTFGKYVTPGETIKVFVDADVNGVMPQLVLGQLANDKNGWTRFYKLKPGLNIIKAPEFSTMAPAVMYIYNPALPSDQGYAPRVRVEGGTAFPVYYHGTTDPAEYEKDLEAYNQKISVDDNDFASGVRDDVFYNVTELVSENNIITTSSAGALQGIKEMKSANKTVADTMNDWEKLWHEFQSFSGFVEGDKDPRNDLYNAPFISRVFTKGPIGWSDWGYTGYNGGNAPSRDTGIFKEIVKPFSIGGDWIYYHEWGHNINNSSTEHVEVTNNLYSAQMRRVFETGGKDDRIDWNGLYGRFSGETVSLGFWTNLGIINQPLYYYGTDTYGKASRIARTNPDRILDGLANNQQRLVLTYSLAVGYDLTDFFDGWGYCKSTDLMKSKVAHLPKPNVKLEYMNTSGIGYEGQGFTEETNVNINSVSSNSELKQTTLTFSVDQANKDDVMGYEILRNGEVVGYTTSNSFVDKNIDPNVDYTYEVIAYAKDLTTSKKATISSKTPNLLANSKITIKLNEEFNPLNYVNATDNLGSVISEINVTHDVDTTKKGLYNVGYEVVSNGITVNREAVVEVVSDYEYLSDSDWTSARTDYDIVRKNNNLKLFTNGKVQSFEKGFGIHANGEIVYDLSGENYEKFEAFVGVSRAIQGQNNSSIVFSILGDGIELYNSGLMKYVDAAKFISVDVTGVKELKIVVNDGGNGISSDHGVIANPILIDNNIKPTLTVGETETVKLKSEYDLMASVKSNDTEDGDITNSVVVNSNGFTTDKTGEYNIEYSVTDSDGNVTKAEKTVVVYSESEYLSDIEWKSARTDWGTIQKDLALCGNNITLNINGENKIFDKGIGTHANSEIVYNLEGKNYDYFESYVGIERTIAGAGKSSVIFKIYADGVEVYNSGVMKWEDKAKYVRIPVKGVSELKLVANDAGNGIGSDHADFGGAKFLTLNSLPKLTIPKSVSTKVGNPIELKEEYSAYDCEDGDLTTNVEVTGEVNFDKTGEYTLTYKVTDGDGNIVAKTRTVAVVDMKDYAYLTDYKWASEKHSYAAPLIDKSTSAKALRLTDANGKEVTYSKGLGAHSTSSIIYDLSDKNYDYFTAYVGVDRQMYGSIGSVTFEVYVDGEMKFESGLMNSTDPQKYVEVDINGAKELKLVVTDGGNGDGSDHATWGDTKLHYAKENGTVIDKSELVALINTVNELKAESYTVESVNNLKAVLDSVNTELANGYNQEEIDRNYGDLKAAYDGLVKLTNFSALEEAIDNHSNYNELHYFRDAITAHKAIIEEAKAVLGNKDATQEEVDAATFKVDESAKGLVLRENKVNLEKKINEAKVIENNNYNSLRWSNFIFAIEYAEGIYNNIDATDEDIKSGLFTIEYFKGELK